MRAASMKREILVEWGGSGSGLLGLLQGKGVWAISFAVQPSPALLFIPTRRYISRRRLGLVITENGVKPCSLAAGRSISAHVPSQRKTREANIDMDGWATIYLSLKRSHLLLHIPQPS